MNKTVSRFKKTFRVFGLKIAENEEQYECVNMENIEPINPFIITEYEMENYKNQKNEWFSYIYDVIFIVWRKFGF